MIVHAFLTTFRHESRALKEMQAAVAAGHEVALAGIWEAGLAEDEEIGPGMQVHRVRVRSRRLSKGLAAQLLKYLEWAGRLLAWGQRREVTLVHCHSLASLPVSVLAKWLWRAPLLYDAHELETEKNGLSPLRRRLARTAERLLIGFVDDILVVTPSIAEWYARHYAIRKPVVVINIPKGEPSPAGSGNRFRERFAIDDAHLIFIYQGTLSPGRGVERLLGAFRGVRSDRHLVFMGYGPLQEMVERAATETPNVHFHPAVSPELVLEHTQSADVGFSLIQNTCLSYYYCLPNKLFEYLRCGLPVLVSDFPEMGRIIDEWRCGWRVPEGDEGLAELINNLTADDIEVRRQGARRASRKLNWEGQERRLLEVYARLLGL